MSRRTKGLDTKLENEAILIYSVTSQAVSVCLRHGWLPLILVLGVLL